VWEGGGNELRPRLRPDKPDPELHGRTPRSIIARERARLPEGMSGHSHDGDRNGDGTETGTQLGRDRNGDAARTGPKRGRSQSFSLGLTRRSPELNKY
jgi:hypothetical protein